MKKKDGYQVPLPDKSYLPFYNQDSVSPLYILLNNIPKILITTCLLSFEEFKVYEYQNNRGKDIELSSMHSFQ